MGKDWKHGPALLSAVVLELMLVLMVFQGLERANLPWLTVWYTVAFIAMLWAWKCNRTALNDAKTLFGWALVFRLTLLPLVPDLSDDFFRYIWDGWLMSEGINPYQFRPSDPALAQFAADPLFAKLNSPDYYSVYPPLTQSFFVLGGWLYPWLGWAGSFLVIKTIFIGAELGGLALMIKARQRVEAPLWPLVLYAWNPLVLVVFAGQGHSEAAMMLGMGLAIWGLYAGKAKASWVGWLMAGMVKLVPFCAGPVWLRYWGLRGAIPTAILGVLMAAVLWQPETLANVHSSLDLYVRLFEFNSGLYMGLKELGYLVTDQDTSKLLGPALRMIFMGWAVAIFAVHPLSRPPQVLQATALLLAGYLLTATTVHPWYLTWVLVLVPFVGPLRWAWVWASFASFLTYFTYLGWPHKEQVWFVWIGFAVFAAVDLFDLWLDGVLRRRGRNKAHQIDPHVVGHSILDLGCGEGYVALGLMRENRNLRLADVTNFNKTRLSHVCYNGERLPLSNKSVDTVVLSLVLHHAHNQRAVLEEALRVARRRIVVTESTFESEAEHKLLDFLDRRANRLRGEGQMKEQEEHLHFRTVEGWHGLFEEVGLELRQTRWLGRFIHKHVLFELDVPNPHADLSRENSST